MVLNPRTRRPRLRALRAYARIAVANIEAERERPRAFCRVWISTEEEHAVLEDNIASVALSVGTLGVDVGRSERRRPADTCVFLSTFPTFCPEPELANTRFLV